MLLMDAVNFCAKTVDVWDVVGKILFVFKIVIPILLIIFGMIDLGKAVVGAKDDEIKKATKQLGMRAIAAIVIFLIPTIVGFLVTLIANFGDVENDYKVCSTCIQSPGEKCQAAATAAKNGE